MSRDNHLDGLCPCEVYLLLLLPINTHHFWVWDFFSITPLMSVRFLECTCLPRTVSFSFGSHNDFSPQMKNYRLLVILLPWFQQSELADTSWIQWRILGEKTIKKRMTTKVWSFWVRVCFLIWVSSTLFLLFLLRLSALFSISSMREKEKRDKEKNATKQLSWGYHYLLLVFCISDSDLF